MENNTEHSRLTDGIIKATRFLETYGCPSNELSTHVNISKEEAIRISNELKEAFPKLDLFASTISSTNDQLTPGDKGVVSDYFDLNLSKIDISPLLRSIDLLEYQYQTHKSQMTKVYREKEEAIYKLNRCRAMLYQHLRVVSTESVLTVELVDGSAFTGNLLKITLPQIHHASVADSRCFFKTPLGEKEVAITSIVRITW